MARHRDIRNMDYSDDYDGYDDVYGHSVDDDFFESPSNKQFIYNRDMSQRSSEGDIKEEDEQEAELSDSDRAKLTSCIAQINTTLESVNISRNDLVNIIIKSKFDVERSINTILEDSQYRTATIEKVTQPEIVQTPQIEQTKVISSTPKTVTNITKGFDLPQKGSFTPRSQSPASGKAFTPRSQSPASGKIFTPRSQSPASGKVTPVNNHTLDFAEEVKQAKGRDSKFDPQQLYQKERGDEKEHLYMVVIGHVDAGKSTLMGRLLCELGQVNQKVLHKYEQESRKLGKQSFMYAWVLDETGEERNRGITMDVGRFQFETKTKAVTLLDAPGHKDFIPNMISGAGQADVALLVVDATRGEFESGFDHGGQTREHALLVRSLGVSQLAVAINKLDTVSWSPERFNEILKKLKAFLKQAGFKESDVTFVPCSGLTGQNLVKKPTESELLQWYDGPCLLDVIDKFRSPDRPISKPFRLSINDVFKGTGTSFCVSGRVETGTLSVGDKVLVCPNREAAVVKSLAIEEASKTVVFAGDQVTVALSGVEMQNVFIGNILCDPQSPVQVASKFLARIVVFNVTVPITKGFSVVLHHQSLVEPVIVSKLITQLNKSTGELVKKHPRFLGNNTSAIVEIQVSRPIALELYSECKELGRVMLRVGGVTIAAGLITQIIL
ncbi:protein HBS1 isoform X2 [Diabrotica virgifera virgifera]|uniref:Tr-type G domain-containing protein n=1 Tax=Diabrotica virgifera virgifera TaxID=50390 RepID=A0ABM5IIV3_DIAVI|nr:protein HBS1 isoform X2 [Diabrotica virgifera virgifera]